MITAPALSLFGHGCNMLRTIAWFDPWNRQPRKVHVYSITHHLGAGVAVGHVGPLSWIFVFLERKLMSPGNVSHVNIPASVV